MISDIKFLDTIEVAAPCSASWDGMNGDDRVRFCGDCRKNVYNLSDMTRKEAEALVRDNGEGRLCIRFYRRTDGTVLTDNCPVGLRAMRNMLIRRWAAAASLVAALFAWTGQATRGNTPPKPPPMRLGEMVQVPRHVKPKPKAVPANNPREIMGKPAMRQGRFIVSKPEHAGQKNR